MDVWNPVGSTLSNRGVEPTDKTLLSLCYDWVSCTFKNEKAFYEIFEALKLDFSCFSLENYTFYGYDKLYIYNGIRVLLGHSKSAFMLDFSGSGCRFYESLNTGLNWSDVLGILYKFEGVFTRIDLALDSFNGSITVSKMYKKAVKGHTKGQFRTFDYHIRHFFDDGEVLGETLYFGSPSSNIRFRFYDKLEERRAKNVVVLEDVKTWVRFEICFRKEHANFLVYLVLFDEKSVSELFLGILKRYLLFLVPDKNDNNKWRWKVCPWWEKFLRDVEAVRLVNKLEEPTIFKKQQWLSDSVSKTYSFIELVSDLHREVLNPLNVDSLSGYEKLLENSRKEYAAYNQFRVSIGLSEISKAEFEVIVSRQIAIIRERRKKNNKPPDQ